MLVHKSRGQLIVINMLGQWLQQAQIQVLACLRVQLCSETTMVADTYT